MSSWLRIVVRILLGVVAVVALGIGLAAWLLYAPEPQEPQLSGQVERATLRVGALERSYLIYKPAKVAKAPPLLVVFHGSMGSPGKARAETGYEFDRLADRDGFVVAYPQGYGGNWNDCRKAASYPARSLDIDDLGFFEALVARLQRERNVDPARVFVTGASNGGHFVYRLALERPARIAGAAVFAGNLPTADNTVCIQQGPPPPILIVNGTKDPINPYKGGRVTLFGFGNRGTVQSARQSAAWFARGAGRPVTTLIPARAKGDRTSVTRSAWGGGRVVLLTVNGGGHQIHQRAYRPSRILGRATTAIDGPAEAWAFFSRQPPRSPAVRRD